MSLFFVGRADSRVDSVLSTSANDGSVRSNSSSSGSSFAVKQREETASFFRMLRGKTSSRRRAVGEKEFHGSGMEPESLIRAIRTRTEDKNEEKGLGASFLFQWFLPFALCGGGVVASVATCIFLDGVVFGTATSGVISAMPLRNSPLQVQLTLRETSRLLAIILGLVVISTFVVLQMFSVSFVPHATVLFFQNRIVYGTLLSLVVGSGYSLLLSNGAAITFMPAFSLYTSMGTLVVCLMLVFPYFNYLLAFLDPEDLILELVHDVLEELEEYIKIHTEDDDDDDDDNDDDDANEDDEGWDWDPVEPQILVSETLSLISDLGLSATKKVDKHNANNALQALYLFCIEYGKVKDKMDSSWYNLSSPPSPILQTADFSNLTHAAVAKLEKRKTWVEWKVMREYEMLFSTALKNQTNDLCSLIAIYSRQIAEMAMSRRDFHLIDMVINFFNTFLRNSINESQAANAVNLLEHYRQLAENILTFNCQDEKEAEELSKFVVKITWCLRYYCLVCMENKMAFVSEVIAQDIGTICTTAYSTRNKKHEDYLFIFLSVDDLATAKGNWMTLRGIRRAQIKLATHYLQAGEEELAKEIFHDMVSEPVERIERIYTELMGLDTKEYWEIAERSQHIDFLDENRRKLLPKFFSWFKRVRDPKRRQSRAGQERVAKERKWSTLLDEIRLPEVMKQRSGLMSAKRGMDLRLDQNNGSSKESRISSKRRSSVAKVAPRGRGSILVANSKKKKTSVNELMGLTVRKDGNIQRHKKWSLNSASTVFAVTSFAFVLVAFVVFTAIDFSLYEQPGSPQLGQINATAAIAGQHIFLGVWKWGEARTILSNASLAIAILLTLLTVTSMIILQMAASRYHFHPHFLVTLEYSGISGILGFFIYSFVFTLVIEYCTSPEYVPRFGSIAALVFLSMDVLITFRYFALVFEFLEPYSMIESIMSHAVRDLEKMQAFEELEEEELQIEFEGVTRAKWIVYTSMKQTCLFGFASLKLSDKANLVNALDSLRSFIIEYSHFKDDMPTDWFMIPERVRVGSDFVSQASEAIEKLEKRRMWVEWALFKQYLLLFEECLKGSSRDCCSLIAINTRLIAVSAARNEDFDALFLSLKVMNTFLRKAINAGDVRVTKIVVNQYKNLALEIMTIVKKLRKGKAAEDVSRNAAAAAAAVASDSDQNGSSVRKKVQRSRVREKMMRTAVEYDGIAESFEHYVVKIAWYMRYYGIVALERGMSYAMEVVSQDFAALCGKAYFHKLNCHEDLLRLFLTIDDMADAKGEDATLLGVRRTQLRLATLYLENKDVPNAKIVFEDMKEAETVPRLKRICQEIMSLERPEFWEVHDSGMVGEYLTEAQKETLPEFFSWFSPQLEAFCKMCMGKKNSMKDLVSKVKISMDKAILNKTVKGRKTAMRQFDVRSSLARSQMQADVHAHDDVLAWQNHQLARVWFTPFVVLPVVAVFLHVIVYHVETIGAPTPSLVDGWFVLPGSGASSGLNSTFLEATSRFTRATGLSVELGCRFMFVVLMASMIALQMSAARTVPHIVHLFFSDNVIRAMMVVFTSCLLFLTWVHLSSNGTFMPWLNLVACIAVMVALLLLYPYFAYLFFFLDPDKIISIVVQNEMAELEHIKAMGQKSNALIQEKTSAVVRPGEFTTEVSFALPAIGAESSSMDRQSSFKNLGFSRLQGPSQVQHPKVSEELHGVQMRTIDDIDLLSDFGSAALVLKDKTNAYKTINALCRYAIKYGTQKHELSNLWFMSFLYNPEIVQSPDFINLSVPTLNSIGKAKTWVEYKVMRQFETIFEEGLLHLPDVCYRVCVNTREIAECACDRGDEELLQLCIKFMNTYVRHTIIAEDVRVAFNTMHQYRMLAAFLLKPSISDKALSQTSQCTIAVEVCWYFRYYSILALECGMPFITEIIAHDICDLCDIAFKFRLSCHAFLLGIFVTVDDLAAQTGKISTLLGVRRAQVKLATTYLCGGDKEHAKVVFYDMKNDSRERLQYIYLELLSVIREEFWEISDREMNVNFLKEDQRKALSEFFGWFTDVHLDLERLPKEMKQRILCQVPEMHVKQVQVRDDFDDKEKKETGEIISLFVKTLKAKGQNEDSEIDEEKIDRHRTHFEMIRHFITSMKFDDRDADKSLYGNVSTSWYIPATIVPLGLIVLAIVGLLLDRLVTFVVPTTPTRVYSTSTVLGAIQNGESSFFVDPSQESMQKVQAKLGTLGKVMGTILAQVLTPTLIVLQINSRQLMAQIASLFFRDDHIFFYLMVFIFGNLYLVWLNFAVSERYIPSGGVVISFLLCAGCFVTLFPYFARLFDFLNPGALVSRMVQKMKVSVAKATQFQEYSDENVKIVDVHAETMADAIQQAADFGCSAVQQQDKHNVVNVIESLGSFVTKYMEIKRDLSDMWFEIPIEIRFSHDFVSLCDGTVNKMRNGRIWLEYKCLRQYLMLFNESIFHLKDACYLLAIDTRKIGVKAINMNDNDVLDLVIKFFNSYLRVCLNAGDIRTTYNILHQYRQLAEWLMIQGNTDKNSGKRVVEISSYFRYYCNVALEKDMIFVAETAAFDVCTLCELAYDLRHHTHLDLLNMMLTIDDLIDRFSKEDEDKANVSVRGIRRAQVKLAATYLLDQRSDLAREIYHDMKGESKEMLTRIWQELECTTSKEFWEINDRGINFEYLPPNKKAMLPIFFSWFGVSKEQGFNPNEWKHVSKFLHRAATKPEVLNASVDWKQKGLGEKTKSAKVMKRAASEPSNTGGSKPRVESKMKTVISPVAKGSAAHSSLIGGRTAVPLGRRKKSVAQDESMAFILAQAHREVADGAADVAFGTGQDSNGTGAAITKTRRRSSAMAAVTMSSSSQLMSLDFDTVKDLIGNHSSIESQVTSATSASTSGGVKKKFSNDSWNRTTQSKANESKGPHTKVKVAANRKIGSKKFMPHLRLLNMRENSLMRSGSVSRLVDSRLRRHSRSDISIRRTAAKAAKEIASDIATDSGSRAGDSSGPLPTARTRSRRKSRMHVGAGRRTNSSVLVKHTNKRRHSRRASTILALPGIGKGRTGKRRSIDLIHRHHAMSSPAERPSPQQRGRIGKKVSKMASTLAQKHSQGRAVQKKESRARDSLPTSKDSEIAAAAAVKDNTSQQSRQQPSKVETDSDDEGESAFGGGDHDEEIIDEGESTDMWVFSMYLIPIIFIMLLVVTLVADQALFPITAYVGNYLISLSNPTVEDARSSISLLTVVSTTVVGFIMTVTIIILQISANRFTPRVINLFTQDFLVIIHILLFVTAALFCNGVAALVDVSWGCYIITMLIVLMSLVRLLPYLALLFEFLDASAIFARIADLGIQIACNEKLEDDIDACNEAQVHVVESLDQIADFGLCAIRDRDKGNTFHCIDLLSQFAVAYGFTKKKMPKGWFKPQSSLGLRPDYISLSPKALEMLTVNESWLEWKVMKSFERAFSISLGCFNDVCYRIARNTRDLVQAAVERDDVAIVNLAIKFFNTYMRFTIKAKDTRCAYNLLHQYRMMAEYLLLAYMFEDKKQLRDHVVQICWYLRYYSVFSLEKNVNYLAEIIAHDIASLCILARKTNHPCHDELLSIMLTVDDWANTQKMDATIRGIRRQQVKLATEYLCLGDEHCAKRIYSDMKHEPKKRINEIWNDLRRATNADFWEVNDRGENMDYLNEAQREQLPNFFGWWGLHDEDFQSDEEAVKHLTGRRQSQLAQLPPGGFPSSRVKRFSTGNLDEIMDDLPDSDEEESDDDDDDDDEVDSNQYQRKTHSEILAEVQEEEEEAGNEEEEGEGVEEKQAENDVLEKQKEEKGKKKEKDNQAQKNQARNDTLKNKEEKVEEEEDGRKDGEEDNEAEEKQAKSGTLEQPVELIVDNKDIKKARCEEAKEVAQDKAVADIGEEEQKENASGEEAKNDGQEQAAALSAEVKLGETTEGQKEKKATVTKVA